MSALSIPSTPFWLTNSKTLSASGATANVPLFTVAGVVRVLKLGGIVTTNIGANHTNAYFNLYDQTARVNITLQPAGATLSGLLAGTMISKADLAAVAANVKTAAVGGIVEPAVKETMVFSEFVTVKKSTAATEIDYTYTTTDAPTSGVIQFFIEYQLISADAAVSVL